MRRWFSVLPFFLIGYSAIKVGASVSTGVRRERLRSDERTADQLGSSQNIF